MPGDVQRQCTPAAGDALQEHLEGVELGGAHELQRTLKGQPDGDALDALPQPLHLQHGLGDVTHLGDASHQVTQGQQAPGAQASSPDRSQTEGCKTRECLSTGAGRIRQLHSEMPCLAKKTSAWASSFSRLCLCVSMSLSEKTDTVTPGQRLLTSRAACPEMVSDHCRHVIV